MHVVDLVFHQVPEGDGDGGVRGEAGTSMPQVHAVFNSKLLEQAARLAVNVHTIPRSHYLILYTSTQLLSAQLHSVHGAVWLLDTFCGVILGMLLTHKLWIPAPSGFILCNLSAGWLPQLETA
jgi:hypothetical protein